MERVREDGVFISDEPSLIDLDRVCGWLADESYWAAGRPRETIERSLHGSIVYGAYTDRETQIAVARAVTDRATFAWICDVFVDATYRGKGVGGWLMDCVLADLRAAGVHRVVLGTRDAHEVYRRVGFEPLAHPDRWMEIDQRPTRDAPLPARAR
jgi:GNAT superfamily N-acetyltransferase